MINYYNAYKKLGRILYKDQDNCIPNSAMIPDGMKLVSITGETITRDNLKYYNFYSYNQTPNVYRLKSAILNNEIFANYLINNVCFIVPKENDEIYFCPECGNYYSTQILTKDDENICEECRANLVPCQECGTLLRNRDRFYMFPAPETQEVYCEHCFRNKQKYFIKSYHDTPPLEYYAYDTTTCRNIITTKNNFKGYGVELEIGKAGQKHNHSEDVIKCLNEEVYTMRDGSINRDGVLGGSDIDVGGFEIITHPHTEEALYNMKWKDAFKMLLRKGYRSHDIKTCGLHLHISRKLFNSDEAVAKMMYFYDHFAEDITRFARRNKTEVDKWAAFTGIKDYEDALGEYGETNKADDHDLRYRCVNLQNYNTIEIRIMRGTLKIETFLASLDFMITIAKNANNIDIDNLDDLNEWFKGLKPETLEYIKERKCFGFNAGKVNESRQLEENIKLEEEQI
jgi:hypothetical protein